jgi:hypothetical protein
MTRRQWATGLVGAVVVAGSATVVPTTATTAATPPTPISSKKTDASLGNGLGRLVAQSNKASLKRAGGFRMDQESLTIRDAQDRVLIQLTPQSNVDRAAFRKQAEGLGLVVKTVEAEHGTLEGFAPVAAVQGLAALRGTGTIVQALKPTTNIGKATSQGVAMQRVDRVQRRGVDGKGITIGALSDSYDAALNDVFGEPLAVHAADDVKSGDLPGTGNPRNSQPVVIVEDDEPNEDDTDEGRAMLQIAHDVAPGAKLCFGTANGGLLNFANNVRKLADKSGPCGADVVVDDVTYFDEPMFSDNPLSDAIDDVAAQGTHYFSSAGNAGEQQSWDSKVKLIPAEQGIEGTNLDFSEVDPELYDGGLQDMNPGRGTDVAQNLKLDPDTGGLFDLQWDDPVDVDGPTLGASYFQATGEITEADPEPQFTFTATAAQVGQQVLFKTDAIPSGTTDLILSVDDPEGNNVGTIDTGSSPEVLATTIDQPGDYTITISGFNGDTGDFTVDVSPVLEPASTSTDFNALLFDEDGNYLGAVADLNTITGRPSEVSPTLGGLSDIQLVISRHGTGPVGATQLRNVFFGDMYVNEYSDFLSPSVFGHHMAKGSTAVAAYDPFRPYLPEFFTSAGGDLPVYFDSSGNRYSRPQIRRVPQIASADGGNTTFFVNDNLRDPDTLPNFFGTSASAPHAASIAALVLQKAGGPGSVSPTRMRARLARSTYKHDLDPGRSSGRARGLTITANGPQGYEQDVVVKSMVDPKFFTLRYAGKVPLKSVTFYGETASPTALGTRYPPLSDGIVFDPRPNDGAPTFRTDGFPFTIGATFGGLSKSSVAASFSVPGGGESVAGQYRRMTLSFKSNLKRGQALQFGVDRDLAVSGFGGSNEGNGADELGGATFVPQDKTVPFGLGFVATRADGKKIYGAMVNRLGYGFTPVDGYGLVNAEKAVFGGY